MEKRSLIVRRKLPLCGADGQALLAAIVRLEGILSASLEGKGRSISLAYDLEQIGIDELVTSLRNSGGKWPSHFLAGARLSWWRFTEANARDNAHAPVRDCCNKPPGGG
jgi:hypothetical protein